MDRREMLTTLGGIAAIAATSGIAFAAEQGHEHHHMAAAPGNAALATAAFHCVQAAETGIRHCLVELGKGDKSLAECAAKMNDLKSACTALGMLSSSASPHAKAMAQLTIKVCEESEKECRKFPQHKECMDCADSCKKCIEECRTFAA